MNLNIEIMGQDSDTLENQMRDFFDFIDKHTSLGFNIEHPAVFYNGWAADRIKVFSQRNSENKVQALAFIGLFKCPVVADKYHRVDFFIACDDVDSEGRFSDSIDVALKAGGLI